MSFSRLVLVPAVSFLLVASSIGQANQMTRSERLNRSLDSSQRISSALKGVQTLKLDVRGLATGAAGKQEFLKKAGLAFDQLAQRIQTEFNRLSDEELESIWQLSLASAQSEYMGEWAASVGHLPIRERLALVASNEEKKRFVDTWNRYVSDFDSMEEVAESFTKSVYTKDADSHYVPLFPTVLYVHEEYAREDVKYFLAALAIFPDIFFFPIGLFWNCIVIVWDIFEETEEEAIEKAWREDEREWERQNRSSSEIKELKDEIARLIKEIELLKKQVPDFDG